MMENAQPVAENKITEDVGYKLAEKLLKEHGKTNDEVKLMLTTKGLTYDEACKIVNSFNVNNKPAGQRSGSKDMIFGALWCIGGTVLTISNTGYIFWGAIVFGGIQFFKGLATTLSNDD